MRCPQCGDKTAVIDSRKGDGGGTSTRMNDVREALNWYTLDWVYRMRDCYGVRCSHRFVTVELILDDLAAGWTKSDNVT